MDRVSWNSFHVVDYVTQALRDPNQKAPDESNTPHAFIEWRQEGESRAQIFPTTCPSLSYVICLEFHFYEVIPSPNSPKKSPHM
jgi:hypothetical protein